MSIEVLLQNEDIAYRETNSGYLVRCISPDHEDNNPSMLINKITGSFRCFSCNFSGNVLEYYNVPQSKLTQKRNVLLGLIKQKMNESKVLELPTNRTRFVGSYRGISSRTLHEFKPFVTPEDPSRLTFPLYDLTGELVAFIGRHLYDEEPKYVVSPAGAALPLFPLAEPIKGKILLVEGIFDALNLHDKGLTNATSAFGVSNVTDDKLNLLSLQGANGIDIMFDGDVAGREGMKVVEKRCEKLGITAKTWKLPKGTDPANLTQEQVDILKRKMYNA